MLRSQLKRQSRVSPLISPPRASLSSLAACGKAVAGPAPKPLSAVHEYLSMDLLQQYGVNVPAFKPAFSSEEAATVSKSFPGPKQVIKAQVLAGGRGKGHFDSGLQGGVHLIDSPEQASTLAKQMLGSHLITKQTGAAGRICNAVMLAEQRKPKKEFYAAILNDRSSNGPALVVSDQGGMNIEDVAASHPEAIISTPIPFPDGLSDAQALEVAKKLGFSTPEAEKACADVFQKLYTIFREKDATQIEINPLAEAEDGAVLCMDAKLSFDENAEYRQKEVFALRDVSQENASEIEAAQYGLTYIKLDGNIGCLVNGAGLAMATMDILKLHGGSPANFCDIGGGATAEAVKQAFSILLRDKGVKSIFVNIFGGIMRCDIVAQGIIQATTELALDIPLVVRLQGTKVEEGKKLINESGLAIFAFDGLDEAADAAVVKAGLK